MQTPKTHKQSLGNIFRNSLGVILSGKNIAHYNNIVRATIITIYYATHLTVIYPRIL